MPRQISIIVAAADNGVIGDSSTRLLWKVKSDMRHFLAKTKGHAIIMGRKTHEAIGRPLPDRTNIVITRDTSYMAKGCFVVHSVEEALAVAADEDGEIFITGGGEIYSQMLRYADKIYLTRVHASPDGDIVFSFDGEDWLETSRESHGPDKDNQYAYDFIEYVRAPGAHGLAENTIR